MGRAITRGGRRREKEGLPLLLYIFRAFPCILSHDCITIYTSNTTILPQHRTAHDPPPPPS